MSWPVNVDRSSGRAWLLHHLSEIVRDVNPEDRYSTRLIGEAFADVYSFRARSRLTQMRIAEGHLQGAESSIDKILIAAADQSVFGTAKTILGGLIELDDGPKADRYRKEWLYSRAASIYGGTAEIQRDIVAGQLLHLPRGN
jgi:alkylation response protein AidB-like acyl-CoA dehydrogenase